MADKTPAIPWKTYGIFLLCGALIAILLAALVPGLLSGTQESEPEGGGPAAPAENPPAGDTCTFDHLKADNLSAADSCYFRTHSPAEFLADLRLYPHEPVLVPPVPEDWITKEDAELLIRMIDSNDPAAAVVSPISSFWPFNETSTVGNEAMFLLEGYRTGRYPPAPCSVQYFTGNKSAMRIWWDTSGKAGILDERAAIAAIQDAYPELRAFPSPPDLFPIKSIKTERGEGGWDVAFIVEGSGVPIISARCYHVSDEKQVRLTASVNHSIMVMPSDLSPRTCG